LYREKIVAGLGLKKDDKELVDAAKKSLDGMF
jgi:hypothetical protein